MDRPIQDHREDDPNSNAQDRAPEPSEEEAGAADSVWITPIVRELLQEYRAVSGIGPYRLLTLSPLARPDGLDHHKIYAWMRAANPARSAPRDHLDYVLASWKALCAEPCGRDTGSHAPAGGHIFITSETRDALNAHKHRTRLTPYRLFERLDDEPPDLWWYMVQDWLDGATLTADPDHVSYVLDQWAAQAAAESDASAHRGASDEHSPPEDQAADGEPPSHDRSGDDEAGDNECPPIPRDPITPDIRLKLLAERDRTGLGPGALLSRLDDRPEGLGISAITGWLAGTVTTAPRHHLEYVLSEWQKAPARVWITPQFRAALARERDRTRVSPYALLKNLDDAPRRLRPDMVSAWIAGRTLTAFQHHIDYVLAKWRALPDGAQNVKV